MSENSKLYSTMCSKIGTAMSLFFAFFTISTVAVAYFSAMIENFVGQYISAVIYEILAAIVYFLSFSVAAFLLRKNTKNMPISRPIYTSFKINRIFWFFIVAVIAVNFTLSYLNTIMLTSILPSFASEVASSTSSLENRPFNEVLVFFIISIISTAVVPALCEEYLFRGAVLTNLLPFGKSTAILGSALLFGLMHQNPMQMLYTTLMGVVIGYVYVKTKSIWACVILHFTNNFVTVLEEYLPLLTKIRWIDEFIDFAIILIGVEAVLMFVFWKDAKPSVEENGSFGVTYDRGFDVEEYELELSSKEKVRHFFSPTVIIYAGISVLLMVKALLSFFGIQITF